MFHILIFLTNFLCVTKYIETNKHCKQFWALTFFSAFRRNNSYKRGVSFLLKLDFSLSSKKKIENIEVYVKYLH